MSLIPRNPQRQEQIVDRIIAGLITLSIAKIVWVVLL